LQQPQQCLAGARAQFLFVQRPVIVAIGGFEPVLNRLQVLILRQRSVLVGVGGVEFSCAQAAFQLAGSGELAQLVRADQDLTAEAERLDKAVVAFVSKPPAERSAAAEDAIRRRIEAVKAERDRLQQIFNQRFPDYVALSKPQPVSLQETQALLADDEALLVLDFDAKSYAWIITRTNADWKELTISGRDLDAQVRALRAWLTDPRQRFDPELAYPIYQATFGAFADRIAAKKRLSIITNGALTSLPPQLLVTKDPSGKSLKELDWLVRSHAITVLPSVASLRVLRGGSQASSARKPMIAFADPVFSKAAHERAQQLALRSITSFYRGTQVDLAAIGEHLPQLPGTRKEVKEIAAELKTDPADIKLGLAATETASSKRSYIVSSISRPMGSFREIWSGLPRAKRNLR
jgi:CHAT domain-containing protein